ncbi:MAG TPA: hypothetical protein VGF74_19420 [Thermoleophilaceae bacterium]|jgi:hypothetical protein
MPERWEGDEQGHGVAHAGRLEPGAQELLDALALPDWVAEQPELHLSPHLRGWLEHNDVFELIDARTDDAGAFIVELSWQGRAGDLRGLRAAAFELLGTVAETATYVRQRRGGDRVVFEAATGIVGEDAHFAPHGHVIVLDVRGAV